MSDAVDIDRFVKNPNELLELCREVIDRLHAGANSAVVKEGESQLREISKAIERLERAGVSVPDVLRGEKTRLVASLATTTEAAVALGRLIDEFQELLKAMQERLGLKASVPAPLPRSKPKVKVKSKRSRSAKTSRQELRQQIIRALKKFGGKAPAADVIKEIGKQLDGKLLPGDTEWRSATNDHAWENNAKWERYRMTQEGVMRKGSPRGIWELNKDEK